MKKLLCLVLALAMLFSLCGCGYTNSNDDVRGDITANDNNDAVNEDSSDEDVEFSMGETANNTYKNEFLGLSCTLPSSWTFYTDEEIKALNNISSEYMDEDVAEQIKNATIIYDMHATDETTGSNMNINLEKFNAVQLIALDIKENLEAQFDAIESSFANMGYTDVSVKYAQTTVDGKSFDSIKLTAKIQGVDYYSTVFTFKKGNYLANVTVGCIGTDTTDTLLGYFTVE